MAILPTRISQCSSVSRRVCGQRSGKSSSQKLQSLAYNGKTPDWVLEVTSKSTQHKDEQEKPITYAQMGVSEYFQYDPTGDYLTPALKGRRLVKGRYQLLTPNRLPDGTLVFFSIVLGLEMRLLPDGELRFFNPSTQEYLRSPEESEQERIQERLEKERERLEKEQE